MKNRALVFLLLLVVGAVAIWLGLRGRVATETSNATPATVLTVAPAVTPVVAPTTSGDVSEGGGGSGMAVITGVDNTVALNAAAEKRNVGLPKPYADGLQIERVHVEGNRLVTDIRIPDIGLDSLKKEMLPTMQAQEQGDLVAAACKDQQLLPLLKTGAEISRHFLDKDHKLIFDVVVVGGQCPPGSGR